MAASHSLRWRIGLSVVLVAAVSLLEMVVSLSITDLARGEAQAINIAGTVRMQTYRLAATLQDSRLPNYRRASLRDIVRLDASLHDARLTSALVNNLGPAPKMRYAALLREWRRVLKPLLSSHALGGASLPSGTALLRIAPAFVDRANALVVALQSDTERKINLLRASQIIGLLAILAAFYVTVSAARREVEKPLNELLSVAAKVSSGDFSYRISTHGHDELAQLGQAINGMSEALSEHYADMENQIQARTRELLQKNRSLELLYDVSKCLAEEPYNIASYQHVLRKTEQVMGLKSAILCTARHSTDEAAILASGITDAPLYFCDRNTCHDCLGTGHTHIWHSSDAPRPDGLTLSVPLGSGKAGGGALSLSIPSGIPLEPWEIQTVETVGRHIGTALEAAQRSVQQRRIALLEERNAIARDLHDSLAQSLSYLKIQVARLRVYRSPDNEAFNAVIDDIGEGLSSAYRQLRELLATFRLKIPKDGLERALAATVVEFSDRAGIPIKLNDRLSHALLNSNEEIDILHITREALANIEHHAQARRAWVRLSFANAREAVIRIEDDGIGIAEGDALAGHYGLAIMRERALSIGGTIQVGRRRGHGTQVELRFVPSAYRAPT